MSEKQSVPDWLPSSRLHACNDLSSMETREHCFFHFDFDFEFDIVQMCETSITRIILPSIINNFFIGRCDQQISYGKQLILYGYVLRLPQPWTGRKGCGRAESLFIISNLPSRFSNSWNWLQYFACPGFLTPLCNNDFPFSFFDCSYITLSWAEGLATWYQMIQYWITRPSLFYKPYKLMSFW